MLHVQDRYGGKPGALVDGHSAVLFLAGEGVMKFVDATSQDPVREIDVVPGRLIVWDNSSLLHEVELGASSAPRFMLGAALSRSRSLACCLAAAVNL